MPFRKSMFTFASVVGGWAAASVSSIAQRSSSVCPSALGVWLAAATTTGAVVPLRSSFFPSGFLSVD
uniref:Putative secreted peptide n=1 Tax=Anopheles braziliensis TaxID=58242 RepID=A0A2M3ZQB4_9DIPT